MEIDIATVLSEVRLAFDKYEAALVGNDIDTLDELFWHDPRTVRFGLDECQHGFEQIAAYRRAQPFRTRRRELIDTQVSSFGTDVAVVTTCFLPEGSEALGRQSQTWVRMGDGWRVVSAHVSWLSGRAPGPPPATED